MMNWLEKFNSLSLGMLFSDGYLAPSALGKVALHEPACGPVFNHGSPVPTEWRAVRTTPDGERALTQPTRWMTLR